MAKELHLVPEHLALAELRIQLVLAQPLQHFAHMRYVLLACLAEDEDVVEEDQHTPVQQVAEGVVHELHEGAGRIAEAHRQHEVFIAAVARAERGLGRIAVGDEDLMEAGAQVDLTEESCAVYAVEQLVHQRQRVLVLDSDLVECAVVNDHTRRAVLLLHHERHRAVR